MRNSYLFASVRETEPGPFETEIIEEGEGPGDD